jgi:membrane AbrB-like protein
LRAAARWRARKQQLTTIAWGRWALLVVATVALTLLLDRLRVPSPALFAGLAAGMVLALAGRAPADLPRSAMTGAQAVLGVLSGLLVQADTFAELADEWLPVVAVGLATLLVSMGTGLLLGLQRGVSPVTGMLALAAGGATGLVAVSHELGADERVVAVVQYLRVVVVLATMPVVAALAFGAAHGPPGGPAADTGPWYLGLAVLVVSVGVGLPLARITRLPAGALLGPMLVAVALGLSGWTFVTTPPLPVIDVAYAVIGWQAGIRFTRASLRVVARALPLAVGLIVMVVASCTALGLLLSTLTGASLLDGYLATTPGGLNAVLATAISSGSDTTFVLSVQVLRLLLMLLIAPLLAMLARRWWGPAGPD